MKNKYTVGIETITPEKAVALLDQFPRNRKSSRPRVDSYCEIMKQGNWAPFSVIIIDDNGNTIDGHHRLEAVVKSGVSVDMVVFRGLESYYVPFIDTGRPRSAGDMLAFVDGLDDLSSLRNIAALAKSIIYYIKRESNSVVSPDSLAKFILDNVDSIKNAYSDHKKIKSIGGTLSHAAAIWVIRNKNPLHKRDIDLFVDKISYGENICSGMPSYAARNAIFSSRRRSHGGKVWLESFYTILRAWNAEINGEKISHIKSSAAKIENIVTMEIEITDGGVK